MSLNYYGTITARFCVLLKYSETSSKSTANVLKGHQA